MTGSSHGANDANTRHLTPSTAEALTPDNAGALCKGTEVVVSNVDQATVEARHLANSSSARAFPLLHPLRNHREPGEKMRSTTSNAYKLDTV